MPKQTSPQAPIALIAAMAEEIRPLLRRVGPVSRTRIAGFPVMRFTLGGRSCCLIQSGMGPRHAVAATRALLAAETPRLIINAGFGGAAAPDPKVGDVVVAARILCRHERLFTDEPGLSPFLADAVIASLTLERRTFSVYRGTFVTSAEIMTKAELLPRLPAGAPHPVLEMETAAVARVAAQTEVPLVALRAISDTADEELGFALTDLTDSDLNIRLHKVLLTVARRPRLIPQLLRLARNSKVAGEALAEALTVAITSL